MLRAAGMNGLEKVQGKAAASAKRGVNLFLSCGRGNWARRRNQRLQPQPESMTEWVSVPVRIDRLVISRQEMRGARFRLPLWIDRGGLGVMGTCRRIELPP
jgi:hypothetical protein